MNILGSIADERRSAAIGDTPWEPGRLKLLAALPVKPGHCLGWHVANGSVSSVAFVETRPYQQRWILPDGILGRLIAGGVQNVLEKEPK